MTEAVSRRPLTAEGRVRALVIPCGICGEQGGIGTGFPPSSLVFSCQYLSTVALHTHISWEMNNRPFGGRSPETSSHSIDTDKNKE
jgi:hypothetical protein